jgi:hypothetical protein
VAYASAAGTTAALAGPARRVGWNRGSSKYGSLDEQPVRSA